MPGLFSLHVPLSHPWPYISYLSCRIRYPPPAGSFVWLRHETAVVAVSTRFLLSGDLHLEISAPAPSAPRVFKSFPWLQLYQLRQYTPHSLNTFFLPTPALYIYSLYTTTQDDELSEEFCIHPSILHYPAKSPRYCGHCPSLISTRRTCIQPRHIGRSILRAPHVPSSPMGPNFLLGHET